MYKVSSRVMSCSRQPAELLRRWSTSLFPFFKPSCSFDNDKADKDSTMDRHTNFELSPGL